MTTRKNTTLGLCAVALLAGCASGPPFIDQAQPEALAIAQRRAAFEFNCPAATTQVLSRETLLPERKATVSFDRSIDLRIMRLRRKVERNPARPMAIRTVRGAGYSFDETFGR